MHRPKEPEYSYRGGRLGSAKGIRHIQESEEVVRAWWEENKNRTVTAVFGSRGENNRGVFHGSWRAIYMPEHSNWNGAYQNRWKVGGRGWEDTIV